MWWRVSDTQKSTLVYSNSLWPWSTKVPSTFTYSIILWDRRVLITKTEPAGAQFSKVFKHALKVKPSGESEPLFLLILVNAVAYSIFSLPALLCSVAVFCYLAVFSAFQLWIVCVYPSGSKKLSNSLPGERQSKRVRYFVYCRRYKIIFILFRSANMAISFQRKLLNLQAFTTSLILM